MIAFPILLFAAIAGPVKHRLQGAPSERPTPFPVPFRLTDDGRACSGYFHLTATGLVWNSSWLIYRARAWTSTYDKGIWLLKLQQPSVALQPRAAHGKVDPMRVITIERSKNDVDNAFFDVAGYASQEALDKSPDDPLLACQMQH